MRLAIGVVSLIIVNHVKATLVVRRVGNDHDKKTYASAWIRIRYRSRDRWTCCEYDACGEGPATPRFSANTALDDIENKKF